MNNEIKDLIGAATVLALLCVFVWGLSWLVWTAFQMRPQF